MVRTGVGRRVATGAWAVMALAGAAPVSAQEPPSGIALEPAAPRYYVLTDANVRARPETSAERLGILEKDAIVAAVGKAAGGGDWVAVKRADGIGFVYATALAPMIDGALVEAVEGTLAAPGRPDCAFVVTFAGETPIPEAPQQTADYDVALDCTAAGGAIAVAAGMFITELPYKDMRTPVYQINVDVWEMPVAEEAVLSVTALYDPGAGTVAFDTINEAALGSGEAIAPVPAADVPAALAGALAIAHRAWGAEVWSVLAARATAAAR